MSSENSHLAADIDELNRLFDKSDARPAEFIDVLQRLNAQSRLKTEEFSCPAAFVEFPMHPSRTLWGCFYNSFWHIGSNATELDFPDFIKCAELIPDDGILSEMMFVMIDAIVNTSISQFKTKFIPAMPFFLTEGRWNGNRTLLLAIKLLVEAAGVRYDKSIECLKSIIEARAEDEKPTIVLAIIAHIVFTLCGDFIINNDTTGNLKPKEKNKMILSEFLDSLEDETKTNIDRYNLDLFSVFFGLDVVRDGVTLKNSLETGIVPYGGGCQYAQALIVARLINAELSDDQWTVLLRRTLYFQDRALSWTTGTSNTLGYYASATILKSKDPFKMWTEAIKAWNSLIFRALNGDKEVDYESRLECYFCTAICVIDGLLQLNETVNSGPGRETLAYEIWKRAWSDSITSLHSSFFPGAAFHTALVLFVYAILKFSARVEINDLLQQLPYAELRNRGRTNCRTMCLANLAKNIDSPALRGDLERVIEKHPDLQKEMEAALEDYKRDCRKKEEKASGIRRHSVGGYIPITSTNTGVLRKE